MTILKVPDLEILLQVLTKTTPRSTEFPDEPNFLSLLKQLNIHLQIILTKMKTKNLHYVFSLFSIFLLYSCENNEPLQIYSDSIVGKWRWINTWRVIPPSDTNPETPKNTGIEELLVFNTDFTWYKTQNNLLVDSGSYSLESGSYTYPAGDLTLVYDSIAYYKNNVRLKNGFDYYEIQNDTLVFCSSFGARWSSYTLSHSGTKRWVRKK